MCKKKKHKKKKDTKAQQLKSQRLAKYLRSRTTYKVIKLPLKKVVRSDEVTAVIEASTRTMNKLVTHALMFTRLYLLHLEANDQPFPLLDDKFFQTCMKLFCVRSKQGRHPSKAVAELKTTLQTFYEAHYHNLHTEGQTFSYKDLNIVMQYESISMVTDVENNINIS